MLLLNACAPRDGGKAPSPKASKQPSAVNTGLSALASNSEAAVLPAPDPSAPMTDSQKADWARMSALSLEQLIREGAIDDLGRPTRQPEAAAQTLNRGSIQAARQASTSGTKPRTQSPPATASTGLGSLAPDAQAALDNPPPAPSQEVTAPAASGVAPQDPLADLASRMASLLRPAPGKSKAALSDSAALVPIDALSPGVLTTLDQSENVLAKALAPADLSTLRQARERLLADASTPAELLSALRPATPAAPAPVAQAPAPQAKQFAVTRSALCTRVTGFGRFDPYSSTTFVAGRAIRAIVYTELDGFASRPARSGDPLQSTVSVAEQVSVQLSQTLTLYNDKDGLLAWHRPAQSVTETSRSARRDFYLIQVIELPPTLSIGRYNLKVTVADATTGAEAESIIPIDVVADPSLVYRSR
ncbi:MAG: hypothetical protein U0637_07045 [Phycisphaerales bacterium]